METFDVKLLRRAIGDKRSHRSVHTLYGDKQWAQDLDIVNELGGHTGCVNALSWSSKGHLLASGSDDTYLNIWGYNPENLARPFTLNTSVATGHHANIFSVKFMPHSNDGTVVTCAGDSEVRVFDLEYSGTNTSGSTDTNFSTSTRSRRFQDFFPNTRWLSEGSTNSRVYRSHGDRAKRIVTESSPYLFLSCSEDGEVRQWDLRLPSSAYPSPTGGGGQRRFRRGGDHLDEDGGSTNVPPPLISYKRYGLDLNTISCSGSQPQYIALGGAHLHCFLHDRRMLGRDRGVERGSPPGVTPLPETELDDEMSEATRCVRRFAPHGRRKMSSQDHGHITACKISDANPNEMIASWSGDYIYSFDIVKSPDARDKEAKDEQAWRANRLRHRSERKRKRSKATASGSSHTGQPDRQVRRVSDSQAETGDTALRVQLQNGDPERVPSVPQGQSSDPVVREVQWIGEKIARSLVKLRKTLFDFSAALSGEDAVIMEHSEELTAHTTTFTNSLGTCSLLLPQMDEIISAWSYPVDPDEEEVIFQNTLRRNRQASWRFVQAAGCLSRTLGGKIQTLSSTPDTRLKLFDRIQPAGREGRNISDISRFCYDFLKAILLWLDGGQEAVLNGFKRPANLYEDSSRFPLDNSDTTNTAIPKLQAYLNDLADDSKGIIDLDSNMFELDEHRNIFQSQNHAVQAFIRALEHIVLETAHGPSEVLQATGESSKRVMDKGAACRFWALKVGRSLLLEAAEGVNFDFVYRAFGGLGTYAPTEVEATTSGLETSSVSYTNTTSLPTVTVEEADEDGAADDDDDDEENDDDDASDEEEEEERDAGDDDDEASENILRLFRRGASSGRPRERALVNLNVPYSSHSRYYQGHCNTRTVKDVNYYGLDDEYIVSGSDDGHFFIWDKKTSRIVNILEGDGEVVNVVQGHPYEPMIACSGIDSTVKIFGPGGNSRERDAAERGIDIANPGGSVHSSLRFGGRRQAGAADDDDNDTLEDANNNNSNNEQQRATNRNGLGSRKALHRAYEITSQNDAQRQRGMGDGFVTAGMLARFAAALQRGQIQGIATAGGGGGLRGGGGTIVVDDNCLIM